jgi:uncharacterized membrane protein YkvA (DUF1232 family)
MNFFSNITAWISTPYTIYQILKDPIMSRSVKIRSAIGIILIFAYVISPVDLIPEFIPMSGLLDDLIVVPLGLTLMRKFIPDIGILEKQQRTEASVKKVLPWIIFSFVVFVILSLVWLGVLIYFIVKLIAG